MKVLIDHEKLRKKAVLSHIASLGGLLILLGSVAVGLWKPQWGTLVALMLFGGFSISVVGIYYANRWVKKPRPEEILNQALKGLDDKHRLYHYLLPCDHILLTTSGVVVIETCNLEGQFSYKDGKWRQKITASRAMRFFVEERLGDPFQRASTCAESMQNRLNDELSVETSVPVHAVIVFTHPWAEVKAEGAPMAVCQPDKLRSRLPKNLPKLSPEIYQQMREKLDLAAGLAE